MTSACHAEDHGFESRTNRHGSIAQSVEQRTENPCVTGSIPVGATILILLTNILYLCYIFNANGRLAQLVRAPALQAGGHRFESYSAHHFILYADIA